jgi:hypothetical protein
MRIPDYIKTYPEKYKVCVGCGSILLLSCNICPTCHTYKFNEDPECVRRSVDDIINKGRQTPEYDE